MIWLRVCLIVSAVALIVMTIYCNAIYDWGTDCAHRWGWTRIVKFREKMKHWALPFSQLLLILLAGGCLLGALFLK